MSSNGEKAVAAEVSPVVSTSSSDPLSSPEEDKCILTPLSLEFDPLSWKLDEKSKSNNCSPDQYSAALLSKDLMTDSVQSYDLLTMDDNWDLDPNQPNPKCDLNPQLIQEFEPTLANSDYDSNDVKQSLNGYNGYDRSDSPVDSLTNDCDATNCVNANEANHTNDISETTDITDSTAATDTTDTNECRIETQSQPTNQSIASETTLEADLESDQKPIDCSSPVNVESAQLIASKLINECVFEALHENIVHLTKDETLSSSSSLSDSSFSDDVSCESDESAHSNSSGGGSTKRKKKSNRKKSQSGKTPVTTSNAPKAEPSEPLHLTQQQMTTEEAKSASNEMNQKSVSATPVVETKPELNGSDGQESVKGRPKKYEMIICENTPQELPPDVVRSDSKTEEHFENLAINLANIRNRFEKGCQQNKERNGRSAEKSGLVRSESILLRLQKYQSAVMGEREPNSSSDDELNQPKENEQQNEIMALSGQLSSIKSQWEAGSVASSNEEADRNKEELENLRKNLSLGRSESLKQVYERAIKESESAAKSSDAVVLDSSVKTNSIKEKFERKNSEPETEEQRLEKMKKERDEDLQAISDSTAKEARNKFKQIDATATKSPTPQQNGHSNGHSNGYSNGYIKKYGHTNGDVVKSGGPVTDDVTIDSVQLQERKPYFENLPKEAPKESKRHQITPPREVKNTYESNTDDNPSPDVVRSSDVVDDIPKGDTAKKMLDKFKALESQTDKESNGPKPLKRITPPRDVSDNKNIQNKKEPTPERDPNIIRSSLKDDEPIQVEPERARNLKAKFENWSAEIERQNSKNNGYDDDEEFIPHIDTTKNLRKKFEEAMKEENKSVENKPKIRVNRFVSENGDSAADLCYVCRTKLYPMEKLEFSGIRLHKNCFRCIKCKCNLRLDNFTITAEKLYCIPHYKQLFMEKGNYDEGFGLEQHKDKWNNKCINNNDLIVNNNHTSELICDQNANDSHIVFHQSVSDASDNDY